MSKSNQEIVAETKAFTDSLPQGDAVLILAVHHGEEGVMPICTVSPGVDDVVAEIASVIAKCSKSEKEHDRAFGDRIAYIFAATLRTLHDNGYDVPEMLVRYMDANAATGDSK